MATLRGLVKKLGGKRPASRYLQDIGVTLPNGNRMSDRWIGDQLRGGASHHKNPVTAKKNIAYIDAKIKNVDLRKVKPVKEGEGGIHSGAEPGVQLLQGSKIGRGPLGGDRWVGTIDVRGQQTTKELTKQALRKLLAGSGLSTSSDWKLSAFGEYLAQTEYGSDPFTAGVGFWQRKWRRVSIKLGAFFFDDWTTTELEIAQEVAHATQVATDTLRLETRNPLAALDAHRTESIKRKIARGDPKDPEHYPSFAARYCTIASGGTVIWRNVYAASLNYPVGGQ